APPRLRPFPTRRSSDLPNEPPGQGHVLSPHADVAAANSALANQPGRHEPHRVAGNRKTQPLRQLNGRRVHADHLAARCHERTARSEEHTSELQSPYDLV